MECCEGYCHKCKGMLWSLLGVLILINAFVWPQWSGVDGWMAFFGLLLLLGGVWKSIMPGCACHKECAIEPVKEAKKKK